MLQPATPAAVLGDFRHGELILHGASFHLRAGDGSYYIAQSGSAPEHHVDYTLGSRRIQHYLSTLSDGRIVVIFSPSWNMGKRWNATRPLA